MDDSNDPLTCSECARNRALIAKLDERLTALELEVRGAPVEIMLEEFEAAKAQRDARRAAIDEFHRLQQEEFYKRLPELKKATDERKTAYEQFMRDRGFEP
jgi:hypothetical protein